MLPWVVDLWEECFDERMERMTCGSGAGQIFLAMGLAMGRSKVRVEAGVVSFCIGAGDWLERLGGGGTDNRTPLGGGECSGVGIWVVIMGAGIGVMGLVVARIGVHTSLGGERPGRGRLGLGL